MADRAQLLNDAEEAMRLVLDGRQSTIWTALPGIIESVNFAEMTCEVQPAIQGTVEDESGKLVSVDYPLLIHVPIVFPSAGGFTITFPLSPGDEVLVVWASRAIDAWWESGGAKNRPVEARMHDLSDGFAIPGPKSKPNVIGSISTTAIQIRNDAGTSFIEIDASGKINITGDLTVTGKITATEDVVAGSLVPATEISLLTHTHTSAIPGNPTSPPLP